MAPEQPTKPEELGTTVSYASGDVIFQADFLVQDPCIFLIRQGQVSVAKKYTPLQKEDFLHERGDLFGMLEVFTGGARTTTARALTDVELAAFSRAEFERSLKSNLNLAIRAIRQLSKMLRQINGRIKKLH